MSNRWTEKAVYYRTTTDGKTKWVKIDDVAYSEAINAVIMYGYKDESGWSPSGRRIYKRESE